MKYKKSLGQNFIYDTNLLKSIASDALICREDVVVEIGAGAGTLTKVLSDIAKKVISFEIDKDLKDTLLSLNLENAEFVFEDALKYPLDKLHERIMHSASKYKLVANLPYYITTPLLFKFLEDEKCTSLTIMIQKEVAMRIVAKENTADYGILSVLCQALSDITYNRTVSKKVFTPMPKVDSAVITLKKNLRSNLRKIEHFKRIVKASFAMRRKTLSNNLMKEFFLSREEIIEKLKKMQKDENI